jgi:hypothetical protein
VDLFRLAGDVLWIIALSIMAASSRAAWMRIDPTTTVPMNFKADGAPGVRISRAYALCAYPVLAFVVGMVLVAYNRNVPASGDAAVILFGVRSLAASLFAIAHLRWLKAAMDALAAEGRLKDPQ